MKLTSNPKPVKFRIKSGEVEHSSLDSLLSNFCLNDLVEIGKGPLVKWLSLQGEKGRKIAEAINNETITLDKQALIEDTSKIFSLYSVFFSFSNEPKDLLILLNLWVHGDKTEKKNLDFLIDFAKRNELIYTDKCFFQFLYENRDDKRWDVKDKDDLWWYKTGSPIDGFPKEYLNELEKRNSPFMATINTSSPKRLFHKKTIYRNINITADIEYENKKSDFNDSYNNKQNHPNLILTSTDNHFAVYSCQSISRKEKQIKLQGDLQVVYIAPPHNGIYLNDDWRIYRLNTKLLYCTTDKNCKHALDCVQYTRKTIKLCNDEDIIETEGFIIKQQQDSNHFFIVLCSDTINGKKYNSGSYSDSNLSFDFKIVSHEFDPRIIEK